MLRNAFHFAAAVVLAAAGGGDGDGDVVMNTVLRATGVIIKASSFQSIAAPADQVAVLWRILDPCAAAEERARVCFGKSEKIPPAVLTKFEVYFLPYEPIKMPILGQLSTDYPLLVRSLQYLKIRYNEYDESAALGAFAALATNLTELTFHYCGLASLQGLAGRCEFLRKVDVSNCSLWSLEGLGDRAQLLVFIASHTYVETIEPLRTCPNLTHVYLDGCCELASIEPLEGHQWLKVVVTEDES